HESLVGRAEVADVVQASAEVPVLRVGLGDDDDLGAQRLHQQPGREVAAGVGDAPEPVALAGRDDAERHAEVPGRRLDQHGTRAEDAAALRRGDHLVRRLQLHGTGEVEALARQVERADEDRSQVDVEVVLVELLGKGDDRHDGPLVRNADPLGPGRSVIGHKSASPGAPERWGQHVAACRGPPYPRGVVPTTGSGGGPATTRGAYRFPVVADSPFVSDVPARQALDAWREACAPAGGPARVDAVRVPVGEAVGRVTAEPVWARRSSPAYDSAGMDGIAVRAADTVGAAETTPVLLTDFVVVDTGDPMPDGYDAVVMREHVHRVGDAAELRAAVPPYAHVRSIGEDVAASELLLPAGHRLRPVDVAAAAAAGAVELVVRRPPRVVVVPTGDEIRPVGTEPAPGEIVDTNSLMLAAQARELGCTARVTEIVPDDPALITEAMRKAAADADLVVLVAGSSAGRDDYTARVVAGAGTLAVHGVAVRPGHPVVLGAVDATPVLGAPGYPVSAALTFEIFAAPLLAELEGAA